MLERVLGSPTPVDSLRALVVLRQHLSHIEESQVASALAAGESFGSIARALGISRQAAHRRFRHLANGGTPVERPVERPAGKVLITSEARTAVHHAREEAAAVGAAAVGTEHLLLGVLRCERAEATRVLTEMGADLDTARAHLQPTLADQPVAGTVNNVPAGPLGISPFARDAFERALRVTLRRGDGFISVEHLLIAALESPDGGAARTLEAMGVDAAEVRRRLAA